MRPPFRSAHLSLAVMLAAASLSLAGCLGGGGGTGGSGSGAASVTVTPSLGKIVGATVTLKKPDGTVLGSGTTNAAGVATISIDAAYSGPVIVEVAGAAGATYYDEASDASTPFPAGEVLRAVADNVPTSVGVTTLTEMAYQAATVAAGSQAALTATVIQNANNEIRAALAPDLAGSLLTPPTVVGSAADIAALSTSDAGKYAARLSALAQAAKTADAANSSPALAMMRRLRDDMSDGRLDDAGGSNAGSLVNTAGLAAALNTAVQTTLSGNATLRSAMQGTALDTSRLGNTLVATITVGSSSGSSSSGSSTSGSSSSGSSTSGSSSSGSSSSGTSAGTLVERALPSGLSVVNGAATVSPAVFDGTKLYAFLWNFVSHSNYYYNVTTTTDGVTWSTPQKVTGITNSAAIAAANGVLVAATPVTNSTNTCTGFAMTRSTDGVTWSAPSTQAMSACIGGSTGQYSMYAVGNGFVLVDHYECKTLSSTDAGQTWSEGQILASGGGGGGVNGQYKCGYVSKVADGTLVAEHGMLASKPGINWIYQLHYSTSSDGRTWTPHTVDLGSTVQSISQMFPTSDGYKVYSGTEVWTSTDLSTWTKDAAPATTPWPTFYVGSPTILNGKYYGYKSSQLVSSVDGLSYAATGLALPTGVTLTQGNWMKQNIFFLAGAQRVVVFGSKAQKPVALTDN